MKYKDDNTFRHCSTAREESSMKTAKQATRQQEETSFVSQAQENWGNQQITSSLSASPQEGLSSFIYQQVSLDNAGVQVGEVSNQQILRRMKITGQQQEDFQLPTNSGKVLPVAVRQRMEEAMGHDFAHVRVHTDALAAQAAEKINANAFTCGAEIYFGAGKWAPGSRAGDRLLAHELTHVIQHDEGRVAPANGVEISSPNDSLEQEAYANEAKVLHALSAIDAIFAQPESSSYESPREEFESSQDIAPSVSNTSMVQDTLLRDAAAAETEISEEEESSPDLAKIYGLLKQLTVLLSNDDGREKANATKPEESPKSSSGGAPQSETTESFATIEMPAVGSGILPAVAAQTDTCGAGLPAGSFREPDELVDHYMKVHWDRSEYSQALSTYNVMPDVMLPAFSEQNLGPAANLLTSATWGTLDVVFMEGVKAIPLIGILGHVVYGIRTIASNVQAIPEAEGPWDEVLAGMEVLRGCLDMLGGVVANISDVASAVEIILGVAGAAGGATAGAVAGGTAGSVAPGAGTAAGGAGGATAGGAAGGAAGLGVGATVSIALSTIVGLIEACKGALDLGMTIGYAVMAESSQRQGLYETQSQFAALASSAASRTAGDALGVVLAAGDILLTLGTAPGGVAKSMVDAGVDIGMNQLKTTLFNPTVGAQVGDVKQDQLAITATDLMAALNFGDAMRSSGPATDAEQVIGGNGPAAVLIEQSHHQLASSLEESWELLQANDPSWYQELINTLLHPEDPDLMALFQQLTVPSGWMKLIVKGIIGLPDGVKDLLLSVGAGALGLTADTLEQTISPTIEWLGDTLPQVFPMLDEWLLEHSEAIRQYQMNLVVLRDSLQTLEEFADTVEQMVDFTDELTAQTDSLMISLEGQKIARSDLPSALPGLIADPIIEQVNAAIDGVISQIKEVRDRLIQTYDSTVGAAFEMAQGELDVVQRLCEEGGTVEQLLQQAYDEVAAIVASFMEGMGRWLANEFEFDFKGLANWFRQLEAQLIAMTSASRWQEFLCYVGSHGQQSVDDWRSEYADDVELSYHPEVPDYLVDSAVSAYQMIRAALEKEIDSENAVLLNSWRLDDATEAKEEIEAERGQQGIQHMSNAVRASSELHSIAKKVGV